MRFLSFPLLLLLLSAVAVFIAGDGAGAAILGLDLHHRFSPTVRHWFDSRGFGGASGWPENGTAEYYAALAAHDRALHGRSLSSSPPDLTFSEGNVTIRITSLSFLHYAMVTVGTPGATFLVALDTGSDLFWLPCDCYGCASSSSLNSMPDFQVSLYSPNASVTSHAVPCNSNFCEQQKTGCSGVTSSCPYKVVYVSNDTSSSGIFVEDVMFFRTEDTQSEIVEARIIFGCGQDQTGAFLEHAAPNGLLGLGMEKVSVPSILSSAGFTSNSFSMCFGHDDIGRISFGDKGSLDQDETPFNVDQLHPKYNINIIGMLVGNSAIDADFSALVDTGTSFTYFIEPIYSQLSKAFHEQVQDKQYTTDSKIPFEYCYIMSSGTSNVPTVTLTTSSGSPFPVNYPIIAFPVQANELAYCFAVAKGDKLNIIGQNFLTGLQVVFDRERMILGWKKVMMSKIQALFPQLLGTHHLLILVLPGLISTGLRPGRRRGAITKSP
ncbi:aspartyl protease family protein 1-like isoform X2 [Dioscorea cayenensis subsp. rotundata]|uniref:Aspartyl protease family protein 1-like isoform X2 n=1 Tax=Dioscorea cayennensis subsp. rotundata TaxID=55577 RepID=A0AB40CK30_DIOCR|nr:aspartyl protease family protein 1-like isoform X2 [Dioscorea cayenensis subsp. rotundata]